MPESTRQTGRLVRCGLAEESQELWMSVTYATSVIFGGTGLFGLQIGCLTAYSGLVEDLFRELIKCP